MFMSFYNVYKRLFYNVLFFIMFMSFWPPFPHLLLVGVRWGQFLGAVVVQGGGLQGGHEFVAVLHQLGLRHHLTDGHLSAVFAPTQQPASELQNYYYRLNLTISATGLRTAKLLPFKFNHRLSFKLTTVATTNVSCKTEEPMIGRPSEQL